MGRRVTADAGTVAGTNGEFGSLDGDVPTFLFVSEPVYWDDDSECPIIAGARFEKLSVPSQIARELDERVSGMWMLTSPDADTALGSDLTAFPATLSDPVISEDPIREPFAWDPDRLVMWYDDVNPKLFDPSPYQFEDGMVISRSDDPHTTTATSRIRVRNSSTKTNWSASPPTRSPLDLTEHRIRIVCLVSEP